MRIVSGAFRGRKLVFPLGNTAVIRPTLSRNRETIFNILMHRFWSASHDLSNVCVADVFAGTGAMGFEALSRGAAHVTFIDHAPEAHAIIKDNMCVLGVEERSTLLKVGVLQLPLATRACKLAFIDPPYYGSAKAYSTLAALQAAGWLEKKALCIVEYRSGQIVELPTGFLLADTRTHGKTAILFLWAPD